MRNLDELTSYEDLKRKLMKRPGFVKEYNKSRVVYQIADQIIGAKIKRKMSSRVLAKKAGTSLAVISRLEGMNLNPSISFLKRVAKALQIKINLTIG